VATGKRTSPDGDQNLFLGDFILLRKSRGERAPAQRGPNSQEKRPLNKKGMERAREKTPPEEGGKGEKGYIWSPYKTTYEGTGRRTTQGI